MFTTSIKFETFPEVGVYHKYPVPFGAGERGRAMSSRITHEFNSDFDKVLDEARTGKLPKPKLRFYMPAYYGTSLSGEGMGIYDGRKLVAKVNERKK